MEKVPSDHFLDICKTYELKLKEELNITRKIKLVDLLRVKLLRTKQLHNSICVKK